MFDLTVLDKAIIGTTLAITVSVVIAVHNGFENQTKKYKEDLSRAKTPEQVRRVKEPPYTVESLLFAPKVSAIDSYRQQTLRNVAISPQPPLSTRRSTRTRKPVRFAPSEIREFKRESSDKGAEFTPALPLPAVSERPVSIMRPDLKQIYDPNMPEDLEMKVFHENHYTGGRMEYILSLASRQGIYPRYQRWKLLANQKYDKRILHAKIEDMSEEDKQVFIQTHLEKCIQEQEQLEDELRKRERESTASRWSNLPPLPPQFKRTSV